MYIVFIKRRYVRKLGGDRSIKTIYILLCRCFPTVVDSDDVDLRSDFLLWTLKRTEQNTAVIYLHFRRCF